MTPNTPALPSASTELAAIRDALYRVKDESVWVRSAAIDEALALLNVFQRNLTSLSGAGEHVWLKCDACGKDMRGHDRMGHCQPAAMTAVLAYVDALQAENQALRADAARLDFMCSKSPLRFIEGNNDMWRVYQDEAPPEAFAHKWRAIVTMYYPTAREAIDAAVSASGEGE